MIDWEAYEQRAADRLPYSGSIWQAEQREREAYWAQYHAWCHPVPYSKPPEAVRAPESLPELLDRLTRRERSLLNQIAYVWKRAHKATEAAARAAPDEKLDAKARMLLGRAQQTELEDRQELARINQRLQTIRESKSNFPSESLVTPLDK